MLKQVLRTLKAGQLYSVAGLAEQLDIDILVLGAALEYLESAGKIYRVGSCEQSEANCRGCRGCTSAAVSPVMWTI